MPAAFGFARTDVVTGDDLMDADSSQPSPPPAAGETQRSSWHPTTLWQGAKAGLFPEPSFIDFKTLYQREAEQLAVAETRPTDTPRKEDDDWFEVGAGVGGDPWVTFTARDRVGLALSGGGIRSATFNLGLLHALASLGVLKRIDYLATVSGGGYIGGFWTAWLARNKAAGEGHFPLGSSPRGGERAEVRHLREFSRFLLPRVGILETEFWAVVMTVLGGLLPSLVAALAVLALAWGAWMLAVSAIALTLWGPGALAALLLVFYTATERRWRKAKKGEENRIERWGFRAGAALGLGLATVGWAQRDRLLPDLIEPYSGAPLTSEYGAFAPAIVLAAALLVLITARTIVARSRRTPGGVAFLVGVERSIARLVGLTTAFVAVAVVWWASGQLDNVGPVGGTVFGTAGLTALFAWARKWLSEPLQDTRGATLTRVALNWLKRATPRVLATLIWLLLFLLVGTGVRWASLPDAEVIWLQFGYAMVSSGGVVLLTMWWFDPARVGLHEFYRSRISRCYLGASNTQGTTEPERAARNRYVGERPGDDLTLGDLRKAPVRPLHLVCTAANDLSGDHLGTLYRGAKSAVLSANGISVGNQTGKLDYLRLSAALTASAAAFNSHMGRVSMDMGPAVAFLMSALNLRLGLWVPHPTNPRRTDYLLPGRLFLLELLGHSRADSRQLHLSDGNHFENFGLYELIRRHCRYIIVSDCGADPSVTFDDLANVLRRVREDFDVEIELDVEPLRPDANGRGRQHAVVGTIHYDGLNGVDKGTLLYFKPVLTGEEPPDVLQYRSRNEQFPHETTGDQFYDEAQWESYRRLGQHAGRDTLAHAETIPREAADFVDRLFLGVRERLHPAAEGHQEVFVAMSDRCAALEADVFSQGPDGLRRELFAEAVELRGAEHPDLENEIQALSYLMRAIQIMEDVWVAADLEHYWSHPLNQGWMNYFHRWASTPSFRRWWPILRPIYSSGFREFAEERFGVGIGDEQAQSGSRPVRSSVRLSMVPETRLDVFTRGHAWRQYAQRAARPDLNAVAVLVYRMELLEGAGAAGSRPLDVGFALMRETEEPHGWTAACSADDFFVPPALMGAGIVGRMLDALIAHYRDPKRTASRRFQRLAVVFDGESAGPRGRAARDERVRQIEFFKSRGFRAMRTGDATLGQVTLSLRLR